jgi:uncharacterized membrane protein YgcG
LRHPAVRRNQPVVDDVRTVWRKLGGTTTRLSQADLTAWYETQMGDATSWDAIRTLPLLMDRRAWVSDAERAAARAVPDAVEIRDRTVPLEYDVEEHDGQLQPVVRLRLHEKLARTLVVEELPTLDRPLRFVVLRGARGAVRADDFATLQDRLDDPYTDEERAAMQRGHDAEGNRSNDRRRERELRDTRGAMHRHRTGGGRGGRDGHRGGGRGGSRGGGRKRR